MKFNYFMFQANVLYCDSLNIVGGKDDQTYFFCKNPTSSFSIALAQNFTLTNILISFLFHGLKYLSIGC